MVWEKREHWRGRRGKKGEGKRGGRGEDWLVSFNLACKWIHTVERRHIDTPTFIPYTASIRATRTCSKRTGWKDRINSRTFLSEILIQRQWACCHSSSGVWRGNTVWDRCQGGSLKASLGAEIWTTHIPKRMVPSHASERILFELVGITVRLYLWVQATVSQKYSRNKTEKEKKTQKKIWIYCKKALCWVHGEMWCVAQPVVASHNGTDPSLPPVCVRVLDTFGLFMSYVVRL